MGYLVGIDGGGSKTVCVIGDFQGRILARASAGPANFLKIGLKVAARSLAEAISAAQSKARLNRTKFKAVCAGLAGADRPSDRRMLKRELEKIVSASRFILTSDAYITLVAATEGGSGVAVIAGTGSVAMGINARGQIARAGGWGHIVGDEGSGYDIGRRAIMAALRSRDGRALKSLLEERVFETLKVKDTDQLISLVYGGQMTPDRLAALFPVVVEAAGQGDEVAQAIVTYAGSELALAAAAVARKLGLFGTRFRLATSGGLFAAKLLSEAFAAAVDKNVPGAEIAPALHPPEIGALALAFAGSKRLAPNEYFKLLGNWPEAQEYARLG